MPTVWTHTSCGCVECKSTKWPSRYYDDSYPLSYAIYTNCIWRSISIGIAYAVLMSECLWDYRDYTERVWVVKSFALCSKLTGCSCNYRCSGGWGIHIKLCHNHLVSSCQESLRRWQKSASETATEILLKSAILWMMPVSRHTIMMSFWVKIENIVTCPIFCAFLRIYMWPSTCK